MTGLSEQAPAKINLGLTLGPVREDGRHLLVTVMQPVALIDRVRLIPTVLGAGADEVLCAGVEGDNLALAALAAFRERTGWRGAPVRLEIDKRIPVAAGMAGGSADAGAALRLAARAAGIRRFEPSELRAWLQRIGFSDYEDVRLGGALVFRVRRP